MNSFLRLCLIILSAVSSVMLARQAAGEPPLVENFLVEGRLAHGEKALAAQVAAKETDDEARVGLGTLQFVRAVEQLAQTLYKFGALGPESRLGRQFPILRIAVPRNPAPQKVSYSDVREMLDRFMKDLTTAEAT